MQGRVGLGLGCRIGLGLGLGCRIGLECRVTTTQSQCACLVNLMVTHQQSGSRYLIAVYKIHTHTHTHRTHIYTHMHTHTHTHTPHTYIHTHSHTHTHTHSLTAAPPLFLLLVHGSGRATCPAGQGSGRL